MSSHTPARIISATVQRMARLGSLRSSDHLAVIGPGGADALCTLCRLGFDEAVCLGEAAGACSHSDEPMGALLVPDRLSDLALEERLRRGMRWLGDAGLVLVRLRDVDQDRVVQSALTQGGFEIASAVFDLSRGAVVSHRVERVRAFAQAA